MGKVFVVSFLLLSLIMVACGEETKTLEENTPPRISVVDVEESITCDTVEGPCVLVTFDGENCMLEEPKDNETGCYVVAFTNLSDGVAKIEAMTLTDARLLKISQKMPRIGQPNTFPIGYRWPGYGISLSLQVIVSKFEDTLNPE